MKNLCKISGKYSGADAVKLAKEKHGDSDGKAQYEGADHGKRSAFS
ncbi:hypothetical protein [Virgibacillus dokdonensis]|nr:hypothetical protein [Virgibacillus dokdonensis]